MQIVSVDKGLERCAAMLQMLDEEVQEGVQNGKLRGHQSSIIDINIMLLTVPAREGKKPAESMPEVTREGKVLSEKLSKKCVKERQQLPKARISSSVGYILGFYVFIGSNSIAP